MMDILDRIKEECILHRTCYGCLLFDGEHCLVENHEVSGLKPANWETEQIKERLNGKD